MQPIAMLQMQVCAYTRSRHGRCLKPYADYGYCAAKGLHYYGFKLGVRISRVDMMMSQPKSESSAARMTLCTRLCPPGRDDINGAVTDRHAVGLVAPHPQPACRT